MIACGKKEEVEVIPPYKIVVVRTWILKFLHSDPPRDRRITPPYSLIRCAPLLVGVASERSNFAHWLYQT